MQKMGFCLVNMSRLYKIIKANHRQDTSCIILRSMRNLYCHAGDSVFGNVCKYVLKPENQYSYKNKAQFLQIYFSLPVGFLKSIGKHLQALL